MTLRKKTLLAIGATLIGLFGAVHVTSSTILLAGFTRLEKREAQRNVQRVLDAFSNYRDELNALNYQWGIWDETYQFVEDGNRNYITRNLGKTNIRSIRANLMGFINTEGELVYGVAFDLERDKTVSVPEDISGHLSAANQADLQDAENRFTGIVMLADGPMAIATGPILTSEGTGPSRGTLAIGRYLDAQEIKRLGELTHLDITGYPVNSGAIPAEINRAIARLSNPDPNRSILVETVSEQLLVAYTLLDDIYGKPAVLLEVEIPRDIYRQGQISLRYLIVSLIVVGIVFSISTLLLLEKLVLARLAQLSQDVKKIGSNSDLSRRVSVSGNDELSNLGTTINGMLKALESSTKELAAEREKAERLLLNILPEPIADRLKLQENTIADNFAEVTVLFADIVGFTNLSSEIEPADLVRLLNEIFSRFDRLAERHQLEKIKTIGDCYMVVSGLPVPRENSAAPVADMALDMQAEIARFNADFSQTLSMRIGIHTGPVVAGVIGIKKFIYDLWGDTVNIASRMESHGIPGCIHVSSATYEHLRHDYVLEERGVIQVKGKGEMTTYLLQAKAADSVPLVS
jgi:sensor domain CHASE-containing protein/class 3 adenylate cyclase